MTNFTDADGLQFALLGFRTMTQSMQRDFIVGAMDEMVGLAKEGKIDPYLAGQLKTRADLIASFLNETQPGKLKMVVNHG